MKIRSFSYFVDEAITNVVRNSLMSITSIITVSACVFMLVFLLCVAINIESALEKLEGSSGTMTIIVDDTATGQDIERLLHELNAMEYVDEVKFVTAEEALEEFKSTLDDASYLDGLPEGQVLRRRFQIKLESTKYQNMVITQLEAMKTKETFMAKIIHFQQEVKLLTMINNIIRAVCIIIILILLALAIIIIVNTIKLAVNSRRTEISIMKYVGATDKFIRWPFILEGMFIGILGSMLPIIIFSLGYEGLVGVITDRLASFNIPSFATRGSEIFPIIIPLALLFGGVIGTVGSVFSVKRYLDV